MTGILTKLHVGGSQGQVLQYADTGKLNCTALLWSEWVLELWRVMLDVVLSKCTPKGLWKTIGHGMLAFVRSFLPSITRRIHGMSMSLDYWEGIWQSFPAFRLDCPATVVWIPITLAWPTCPTCAGQERALGRLWAWWQRASLWWSETGGVWWLGLSDPSSNPMNLASKISPAIRGTASSGPPIFIAVRSWHRWFGAAFAITKCGASGPLPRRHDCPLAKRDGHRRAKKLEDNGWMWFCLRTIGNQKGKNQILEYFIGGVLWMVGFFSQKTSYKIILSISLEHWLQRQEVEALSAALELVVPPLGVVLMSTSSRLSSRAREAWRSSAREALERGDKVLAKIQLMVADSQLEKEMSKLSATDRSLLL